MTVLLTIIHSHKESRNFLPVTPFMGGGLVPSRPFFVPFRSFLIFLSRILRNIFTFEILQIQIFGGETIIVVIVMLRHFPQNQVSNMPHDFDPTMPHFLCPPPASNEGKLGSCLVVC